MDSIPKWKYWWSYIRPVFLESHSSSHNEELIVLLNKAQFQLCTPNAIYSYGELYNNFAGTFRKIDFEKSKTRNVLILGLGLGSIPLILEKSGYKMDYTAIEIDDVVCHLAQKYVLKHLSSPVTVINTDAEVYLKQCEQKFGMVTMDIFEDDVIPDYFESIECLEKIKYLLNENGVLIYNRLAYTQNDEKQSMLFFENRFSKVFPKSIIVEVKGNLMMVSNSGVLRD